MVKKHPETENNVYGCTRCENTLNPEGRPVESNAVYYVTATNETNPYRVDDGIALHHSDRTRRIRDAIMDLRGVDVWEANRAIENDKTKLLPTPDELPDDLDIPETWKSSNFDTGKQLPISINKSEFVTEENVDPELARQDEDVVQVGGQSVEIQGSANYLICENCLDGSDEINWSGHGITN